jgi:hypothetical protein
MLKNIQSRVMVTAALLSITTIAPTAVLVPAASATVVAQQSASKGNLIADREYEYSERHGRYINVSRHRKHNHNHGNYQYSSSTVYQSQQPKIIYTQPQVIYQPQVITIPQEKRCVRTLYSTICN